METFNYFEHYLHTDEPVLFETSAPVTDKLMEDFQRFNYKTRRPGGFIVNIVCASLFGIFALINFAEGSYALGIVDAVLAALSILMPFMSIRKFVSGVEKDAFHAGNINSYKFYQECFVNTDHFTMSVIPYAIVPEAHETEEYFFIFITKHQAHIIPKNSFIINTPTEMRKLLVIKLGNRFMLHCQ